MLEMKNAAPWGNTIRLCSNLLEAYLTPFLPGAEPRLDIFNH